MVLEQHRVEACIIWRLLWIAAAKVGESIVLREFQ